MFLSASIAYTASSCLIRRTTILCWNVCFSSFDDWFKKRKKEKNCWKKFLICSSPVIFYFKMSIFLSFLLPPQIVKLCYSSGGLSSFTIMGNQIWIAVTMTDEFPGQLSVEKTCLSTLKYFLKSSNEYQTCIMTCRLFFTEWDPSFYAENVLLGS